MLTFFKGAEPTVVARGYDEVHEFEVDEIELNHHVDGVGSFFMGGKDHLNLFSNLISPINYGP